MLLDEIGDAPKTTRDMNAFAQICYYCYDNFNPRLYHWITGYRARYQLAEYGPAGGVAAPLGRCQCQTFALQHDVSSPTGQEVGTRGTPAGASRTRVRSEL